MTYSQWSRRPKEQARLLNPAFIAALIWASARGYRQVCSQGLPYSLVFIAIPVLLHKATREELPKTISASLATWMSEHPMVKVRFVERATAMVPLIKESILFGVHGQLIEMSSMQINAARRPRAMAGFLREASKEVRECMSKSELVGRWFASHGDENTIMALWGVAP